MTIGFLFWLLMLLWIIYGLFGYSRPEPNPRMLVGHGLFLFALFFLLGWRVFGFIIQG